MLRLLLILLLSSPAFALQNQLNEHPSPYLAMHGNDPVAWQDWGGDAVEAARDAGKLLFISSGYFSCHWCHVMQRESYRDEQIARLLNERFIPVKIDRELHGALDEYLIDFVERTQGRAGWPLNVFLTPEGYPLIGFTYMPPERFGELLARLDATWRGEPERARNLARRTTLQLMLESSPAEVLAQPDDALRAAMLEQVLAIADSMEGGFGEQNKFPMAPQLLSLLRLQSVRPHPQLAEFLQLTLDKMADEGLRDQLAGGFFRYTVDPSWQVPHFEKMLYTQAHMIQIYLLAADLFARDDYAGVARDTLDFVLREMRTADGGFVASFSAIDGAGEEGGVYLWHVDELHALLGEKDTALARRYWRMSGVPPFDAGHLPRRGEAVADIADALLQSPATVSVRLASIRARLLGARDKRVLPVDYKQLAGWNGLMLAALSRAALRWNDDVALRDAARRLRDYLNKRLWNGEALVRAVSDDGDPIGKASPEDYAYVAWGMSEYARVSQDPADRTFVAALLNVAWQRFHGEQGWRNDDQPLIPGMAERAAMLDGALLAPSAVLIGVALDSDDPQLQARARDAAERARTKVQGESFWYATHFDVLLAAGY